MLRASGGDVLLGRCCLTWAPGKPTIHVMQSTPLHPQVAVHLPSKGLGLSPSTWGTPFQGNVDRDETFLEPPSVSGQRPSALNHLWKSLVSYSLAWWDAQQIAKRMTVSGGRGYTVEAAWRGRPALASSSRPSSNLGETSRKL